MAAPKVEEPESKLDSTEEKQNETEEVKVEDIVIPEPDKAILDKVTKEMAELYKLKCKHKINDNGSVTFWPTSNCKPSNTKLATNKISMDSILSNQKCKGAASYSNPNAQIIQNGGNTSSFIISSLTAWSEHYPFRFKPEHIWLLILQGVAVHVDQNAEKLRSKYVKHEGAQTLTVEISGNPSPKEWMNTIKSFVNQIDKNTVEDTCKLFDCDFSKSTITEKIATKVTIMDICKNYFEYRCRTMCGFPEITLDGTKQDWIKLKAKTIQLLNSKVDKKFGKQWGDALLPLLDRFIVAFDGNIDAVFWNSMIKRGSTGGSGAYRWFSGWFNILFPFIKQRWNRHCVPYSMDKNYVKQGFNARGHGRGQNDQNKYPTGIASAPVIWDNNGKIIPLRFLAGFVGFNQDPKTLEICPNIAWCIAYSLSDEEIQKEKAKYGR